MRNAYGYARVAQGDVQTMTASLAYQNDVLCSGVAARGFNLRRMFVDIGSGRAAQTELERLLECARSEAVHAIVVTDASRLARDRTELDRLIRELARLGIKFIPLLDEKPTPCAAIVTEDRQ